MNENGLLASSPNLAKESSHGANGAADMSSSDQRASD